MIAEAAAATLAAATDVGATAVKLEIWQLITLLLAFLGFVAGVAQLLLKKIDERFVGQSVSRKEAQAATVKQIDDRFASQEEVRRESQAHWHTRFSNIEKAAAIDAERLAGVKAELDDHRLHVANNCVQREDWIRFGGSIDTKLDRLHEEVMEVREQCMK